MKRKTVSAGIILVIISIVLLLFLNPKNNESFSLFFYSLIGFIFCFSFGLLFLILGLKHDKNRLN